MYTFNGKSHCYNNTITDVIVFLWANILTNKQIAKNRRLYYLEFLFILVDFFLTATSMFSESDVDHWPLGSRVF